MIRFLFGGPGAGKTQTVYDRIRDELPAASASGRRIFLIVPEQSMYAAESTFLSGLPTAAGQVFSVLSFSRLCDVTADRYGGRTYATLTRASKTLLMWRNLRELRALMKSYVTPAGDDTSLCRMMLDISTELSVNAVSPAALEDAVKGLPDDSPLKKKAGDIVLVTSAYEGLVREITGGVPSDRMLRAAEQIRAHDFFKGASVYVDSFTSYTPEEYLLLRQMFAGADNITVTVAAESRTVEDSAFMSVRDTIQRLSRLCDDLGVPYEDVILTGSHRTSSPTLRALGRELWDFSLTPDQRFKPDADDHDALCMISAPNAYEEAHAAVLHIGELHNAGIPYDRIAVVVRDTAEWKGILDACLDEYHIPCFLSDRTGLADKPAARLLMLALRCIRRGYQTGDVISLAKTGLCGVGLADLDAFEEYVETWRIKGSRMTGGPWNMNPDGYTIEKSNRASAILAAANRARKTLIEPLVKLEDDLKAAASPEEQCRALFGYLTRLKVKQQMAGLARSLLSAGHVKEAGETVRLWSFIIRALADLSILLAPDEGALSLDDLSAALSILFEETDIGSVPGRHDCVTVGSASTVRLENVQAVLLLGLCDGEFPRAVSDKGLLTEQDKAELFSRGIELQSRAERQTSEELLYVLRAVTKAADRVLLFTHTGAPDGSAKSPSIAWTRVRWLFPDVSVRNFNEKSLRRTGLLSAAYTPPMTDRMSFEAVRRALPDPVWLSHSALQNYARCPYSYFGSHILKIRERVEAKIDNMNAGTFLHYVFEHFLEQNLKGGRVLRHMDKPEIAAAADAIIDDYVSCLGVNVDTDGRILHLFARLRGIALVLLESIQAELEQGLFYNHELELDTYGRNPGDAQPMEIDVEVEVPDTDAAALAGAGLFSLPVDAGNSRENGDLFALPTLRKQTVHVKMGGRIDRVDVFRDGGTAYIRVIDYKSSQHDFKEVSVRKEMNVQMLLYLFTLCAKRNRGLFADENGILPEQVLPAEVLYISPVTNKKTGETVPHRSGLIRNVPEVLRAASTVGDAAYWPDVKQSAKGTLSGDGLCSPDHMDGLEQEICGLIDQATKSIFEGHAERKPSGDACKFCSLNDSCPVAVRDPNS